MTRYTRIRAARLIDGKGGPPIEDAAVLTAGTKIAAVGPAVELVMPPGETVEEFNYPGGTLMPGLIDVHTHLNFGTGDRTYEDVMSNDSDDLMLLRGVRNCFVHLKAGVTTLRDCGARNRTTLSLRDAANHGFFPSPRLLVSGAPITVTAGHFWWCNGEADGVEGVRQQARSLLDAGVDFLKIMASGGGTQGTDPAKVTYTAAEISAAVGEAHNVGKRTTAHCLAAASVRSAVEGGIDQVEHINFLQPDGSRRLDPGVAEQIVEKGIYVSPTIQTGYRQIERLEAQSALTAQERRQLDDLQYKLDTKLEFLGRFRDLGAKIVAGTDAISTFGDYAIGLELFVRAGLSPMEAIVAATRVAAEAVGVAHVVGTLEVGKEADVIVVRGDPSVDISCTSTVELVMRAGEVIP